MSPMESGLRTGGTEEIDRLDASPQPRTGRKPASDRRGGLSGVGARVLLDIDGAPAVHA